MCPGNDAELFFSGIGTRFEGTGWKTPAEPSSTLFKFWITKDTMLRQSIGKSKELTWLRPSGTIFVRSACASNFSARELISESSMVGGLSTPSLFSG